MQTATSASDSPALDSPNGIEAAPFAPHPVERRKGIEYLESRGFDYPLALFWIAYLTLSLGALIALLWLGVE